MRAEKPVNDLYLETARVRLRQYHPDDFAGLVEMGADPEVMRYLGGAPMRREDIEAGVVRTLLYRKKYDGRLGVFTAELRETGEFMGWFFLRPAHADPDNTKDVELGYRMMRKFWGRGCATEAARALVDKAFAELGVRSVFAYAAVENAASRRVLEKAGLSFERELDDPVFRRRSVLYRVTDPKKSC